MGEFTEKDLNEGLTVASSKGYKYSIIICILFGLVNLSNYSSLSILPFVLYEKRYLCKDAYDQNFSRNCTLKEVCDNHLKFGQDYIEGYNEINKTLATDLGIECSSPKKTSLGVSFFISGLIGFSVNPWIVKKTGLLWNIILYNILSVVSALLMLFIREYWAVLPIYNLFLMSTQLSNNNISVYIIEMTPTRIRAVIYGIYFSTIGVSGLVVTGIIHITGNYENVFIYVIITTTIIITIVKLFVVDSIRTRFIMGDIGRLIDDLEYVARINESQEEFKKWYHEIQVRDNQKDGEVRQAKTENLYEHISYLSIWRIPSQCKLLILTIILSFIPQNNQVFLQIILRKAQSIWISSYLLFSMDIVGIILGILIIDSVFFKRKGSFYFLHTGLFITCFVGGFLFYNYDYNTTVNVIARIFNTALFYITHTYVIEAFPSLTKMTALGINRVLSRVINILQNFFLFEYVSLTLFVISGFNVIAVLLLFFLNGPETMGVPVREFPEDYVPKRHSALKEEDESSFIALPENSKNK